MDAPVARTHAPPSTDPDVTSSPAGAVTRPGLVRRIGPLALVLVAAAWRHLAALAAPFFADDYLFLEQVRGRSLWGALASPDPIGNFLRPVSRPIYFWLVSRLDGESPVVFHAVNLALLLLSLVLLYWIVRRLAGEVAAVVAAAFVAVHYSADVPLLWCSGSQDLLALAGALGAIALHLSGRSLWAALVCALALLSKESVCVVPIVALLLDARPGEGRWAPVRRAWPMLAVGSAWLALWLLTASARPAAASVVSVSPGALPAALHHLIQVGLGLEPGRGWLRSLGEPATIVPVMLVVSAVGGVLWRGAPAVDARGIDRPTTNGLLWAALGALPIAAVASIWSAYFYMFALCGAALALGAWVAGRRFALGVGAVALLAITSAVSRDVTEFATARGSWTAQSHVNRFYVERADRRVSRYLGQLRALHPALPPNATLFFANVPTSTGWQVGDGALARWAYRDNSLRSYYLTSFTLDKARRGPFFFIVAENDSLRDHTGDPDLLRSFAYSMILSGTLGSARDALALQLERHPADIESRYWLAWTQWATGDTASARRSLASSDVTPAPGPTPEMAPAEAAISRGDTASAVRLLLGGRAQHGLDTEVHSRLAALLLPRAEARATGIIEAFAITALEPKRADGWRKLASGQISERQFAPAATSLRRYLALGGEKARRDAEVRQVMTQLDRLLPGGDLAQTAVAD